MRKAFTLAAIGLQLAVLAYIAGEREHILINGKVIHLRTAPIDPRDLFRGDYVRLNYEISRIGVDQLKGIGPRKELKKDDKIFVSLREGPNGLYEVASAQLQKPKEGVYLTGRALHPHQSVQPGSPIWINYTESRLTSSNRAQAARSKSAAGTEPACRFRLKWKSP
jgi:hypothetical protein